MVFILNYAEIGQKIKQRRKSLSLTQAELADLIGLTESSVSRYESGKIATMPTSTVKKICKVLNIDTAELLGLESNSFEYDLKDILSMVDDLPMDVRNDILKSFKAQIKLIRKCYNDTQKNNNVLEKIKK